MIVFVGAAFTRARELSHRRNILVERFSLLLIALEEDLALQRRVEKRYAIYTKLLENDLDIFFFSIIIISERFEEVEAFVAYDIELGRCARQWRRGSTGVGSFANSVRDELGQSVGAAGVDVPLHISWNGSCVCH